MPFDGAETNFPLLQAGAPLALADFVGTLCRLVPGIGAAAEGPDRAGDWWIEISLGALAPGVAWRPGAGFSLYGPGPTLPEQPNAVLPDAQMAAQRLARMLRSWGTTRVAA